MSTRYQRIRSGILKLRPVCAVRGHPLGVRLKTPTHSPEPGATMHQEMSLACRCNRRLAKSTLAPLKRGRHRDHNGQMADLPLAPAQLTWDAYRGERSKATDERMRRLARELRDIALADLSRDPSDAALRDVLAATEGLLRQSG